VKQKEKTVGQITDFSQTTYCITLLLFCSLESYYNYLTSNLYWRTWTKKIKNTLKYVKKNPKKPKNPQKKQKTQNPPPIYCNLLAPCPSRFIWFM